VIGSQSSFEFGNLTRDSDAHSRLTEAKYRNGRVQSPCIHPLGSREVLCCNQPEVTDDKIALKICRYEEIRFMEAVQSEGLL
jgi:hypothetical protein